MDAPLRVLVVLGSVRRDRVGDRLARYLVAAPAAPDHRPDLLDPTETRLPLLDRTCKEYPAGAASEAMAAAARRIAAADAVIVVPAEDNHGIPPALKNLLDHFLEEWFGMTAGIATYSAGLYGGTRAAMQLRMTLPELGLPIISTLLPVPGLANVLDVAGEGAPDWLDGATGGLGEIEWRAEAAWAQRNNRGDGPI
ncbi:MAG: NAD(P)H-dependent oxidoreductase [Pseudomonadota bacterium]